MRNEDLPTIKKKELRGELLSFLHEIYPYPITITSIYQSYYQYYRTETIDQIMQYLDDKGYIEKRIQKGTRLFEQIENYAITPKGIDLMEGSIEDNGIIARR